MKEPTRTEHQREILKYWRLVELFSPQKVDKLDPKSQRRPVVRFRPGQPLPWDALPPAGGSPAKPMVWQHTVFLGVYELRHIYEYLHTVFPADEDAYDERPGGRSACAGLVVDGSGRVIEGSPLLSSAAWAIGRTTNPGVNNPTWIEGFEDARRDFDDRTTDFLADLKTARRLTDDPQVDDAVLRALLEIAHATAQISGLDGISSTDIYIASNRVPKADAADLPAYDFLNSFFLDDLGLVSRSSFGAGLNEYLTPDDELTGIERTDVRETPAAVIDGTKIDRLPGGRWLADPAHPLATSQQFAVNEALHSLGPSAGLMGVNGPPGTGKTTMLRDLLAANVVRRAEILETLRSPDDAFFGPDHTWKSGDYPRRVKQLRSELTGFEMIVASSNNAAVANVSDELPQKNQIHASWHNSADHFAELASEIAERAHQGDSQAPKSWGLVAARLGNSKNRNMFRGTVWFGSGDRVPGLQELLKGWERNASSRPSWAEQRHNFRTARQRVDHLKDAAREAGQRIDARHSIEQSMGFTTRRSIDLDDKSTALSEQRTQAQAEYDQAEASASSSIARRARHIEARPSWLESIFSWGSALRNWRAELAPIDSALTEAEDRMQAVSHHLAATAAELANVESERTTVRIQLDRLSSERTSLDNAIALDSTKYGPCYPGPAWISDAQQRELHGAWQNQELNEARADLFLAALRLHHAFLANAAGVRQSLQAALEVMVGDAPADLNPNARRSAWQLLFLAVPLVSTTFASVGRMLRDSGPEALGWLLIDEAGQATPQAAVGAIWRAKRVLAVGDPMQLTPVVTIPKRAQHDLAKRFDVENTWIPSYTSVQRLADRVGRFGTMLTNGDQPTWVSAPLRVHRRCDSPMFDVSNAIAYENMMIDGVKRSGAAIEKFAHIDPSSWLDVPGPVPGSHLQEAEIDRLRAQIEYLHRCGLPASDIIAISPFRAVAQELRRVADDHPGMSGGTIHTAQGREAAIVFLVLGGDPQRAGAKRWASNTPNLVNVAASRAKRRLYVIGDRKGWQDWPYFDTLTRMLDAHARVPLDQR